MELVALIAIWVLLSVLAARIAEGKGRSGGLYFLLSFFLTPLVGLLMAVVARPDRAAIERNRVASGDQRKCPFCAELVKREAKICRFCQTGIPGEDFARARLPAWPTRKTSDCPPGPRYQPTMT